MAGKEQKYIGVNLWECCTKSSHTIWISWGVLFHNQGWRSDISYESVNRSWWGHKKWSFFTSVSTRVIFCCKGNYSTHHVSVNVLLLMQACFRPYHLSGFSIIVYIVDFRQNKTKPCVTELRLHHCNPRKQVYHTFLASSICWQVIL